MDSSVYCAAVEFHVILNFDVSDLLLLTHVAQYLDRWVIQETSVSQGIRVNEILMFGNNDHSGKSDIYSPKRSCQID